MKFNHINLIVANPDTSAGFYERFVLSDARCEWLGDSLHLRNSSGVDLAFCKGTPGCCPGAHHGFLADHPGEIDDLLVRIKNAGVEVTDDCVEEGFRSIKFRDPDGYEIEVYWESTWP